MTKDQLLLWDPGNFWLWHVKLYSAVLCSTLLYSTYYTTPYYIAAGCLAVFCRWELHYDWYLNPVRFQDRVPALGMLRRRMLCLGSTLEVPMRMEGPQYLDWDFGALACFLGTLQGILLLPLYHLLSPSPEPQNVPPKPY